MLISIVFAPFSWQVGPVVGRSWAWVCSLKRKPSHQLVGAVGGTQLGAGQCSLNRKLNHPCFTV